MLLGIRYWIWFFFQSCSQERSCCDKRNECKVSRWQKDLQKREGWKDSLEEERGKNPALMHYFTPSLQTVLLISDSNLYKCFNLQVAEYESTTFAIFYNNALFLSVLIFASFYVFPATVSPTINYVASMGISAGLIALLSTGTAPA